jgi:hypothetical protein
VHLPYCAASPRRSTRTVSCALAAWAIVVVALSGCAQPVDDAEPTPEKLRTRVPAAQAVGACAQQPEEDLPLDLWTWDLKVSQADWDALHKKIYADVEVPAAVCVQGRAYAIELELQGSSTRSLSKKSFDLKWKKSDPLRSWPYDATAPNGPVAIRKLFLKAMGKDQSLVREALGFDLYRALGYAAPNTGFVNLRINGAYWGLYAVIEPVNERYLAARGYPEGGRLYKAVRKHGSRADFAPGRDLTRAFETDPVEGVLDVDDESDEFEPDDDSDEEEDPADTFQPPPMGDAPDAEEGADDAADPALPDEYVDLEHFIRRLQTTPLQDGLFETRIDPLFSLEAYFDRMLWVAFTQNTDAIAQNYFLYHTAESTGEHWYQLPWDSDISLGADYQHVDNVLTAAFAPLVDGGNYFSRRMLKVPSLRARYVERFLDVLDEQVLEAEGFTRLSIYEQRLSNDLAHDQARWPRETAPHTAFERLEAFISERGAALRVALAAL